ncbi:Uncharacterised protein [Pandoraea pulmonicola]|nr:Uncharacterised protein [Pandoraea pulmonicola]
MPPPAKILRQKTGASNRKVKITAAMLQTWKALGQARIKAAGGLDGVARRDNVRAAAMRNYLRADGHLTLRGEVRLRKAGTRPM